MSAVKGHHLGVIGFLQPAADNGSIQPTRVGEDDFSLVRHGISFEQSGLDAAEILGQGGRVGKFVNWSPAWGLLQNSLHLRLALEGALNLKMLETTNLSRLFRWELVAPLLRL